MDDQDLHILEIHHLFKACLEDHIRAPEYVELWNKRSTENYTFFVKQDIIIPLNHHANE